MWTNVVNLLFTAIDRVFYFLVYSCLLTSHHSFAGYIVLSVDVTPFIPNPLFRASISILICWQNFDSNFVSLYLTDTTVIMPLLYDNSEKCLDQLWGPPSLFFTGYRWQLLQREIGQGLKLNHWPPSGADVVIARICSSSPPYTFIARWTRTDLPLPLCVRSIDLHNDIVCNSLTHTTHTHTW